MTIGLTHEQYWKMRLGMHLGHRLECTDEGLWDLFEVTEHDYIIDLNEAGDATLAAYAAKYRTVEVESLSALVEFAEGELKATDETFAGYPEQLARYDYLRDAIAKVKEAMR